MIVDQNSKRDTVLKLRTRCEVLLNQFNALALDFAGSTITFWCSSNDPGWRFDIEGFAK